MYVSRLSFSQPLRTPPAPATDPGGLTGDEALGTGVLGALAYVAGGIYPSTWAHEMGHATATKILYEVPFPEVTVRPLMGGRTHIEWGMPLSRAGEMMGEDLSWATTAAAAAAVDVGIAMTSMAMGYRIRKQHPIVGMSLMGYAGWSILGRIGYAASALGSDGLKALAAEGHDYAIMAVHGGLQPLAAIGILAAVLPAEYAVLRWLDKGRPLPRQAAPEGSRWVRVLDRETACHRQLLEGPVPAGKLYGFIA